MSNRCDYEKKLAAITAIPRDQVRQPALPMYAVHQEAEYLHKWCQGDLDELTQAGLSRELVDDLPARIGASREAQSNWHTARFARVDSHRRWNDLAPGARELRDELTHAMRYAFRQRDDLLGRVAEIADGATDADLIQDLNDLAVLGKAHLDHLGAVGIDPDKLDQAAAASDSLAELLAEATMDREADNAVKLVRDRAYTHLQEAVDAIRQCGQYVFWKRPERRRGYYSSYKRRARRARASVAEAASATLTE